MRKILVVLALLFTTASAYAANVFYSVGSETGDLKNAATVTISSGTATFSAAQADNVGIGDEIDYDTDNKIAYISARTSSTVYSVVTATGATPSDVSSVTVNSIKRAFNTLASAESGMSGASYLNATDIATATLNVTLAVYADGDLTDDVTVDGYTTSSSYGITITAPSTTTTTGTTQAHQGRSTSTGQRMIGDLTVSDEYVTLDNFRINGCVNVTTDNNLIDRSLIYGCVDDSLVKIANGTLEVRNTFMHDASGTYVACVKTETGGTANVNNSTCYNVGYAGYWLDVGTALNVTNSAGFNCGNGAASDCFSGESGSSDYNASDDAGLAGGNDLTNLTASSEFNSVTAGRIDLHLTTGGTMIGAAFDNSGSYTDDIDGETRSSWDIGADEYDAGYSVACSVDELEWCTTQEICEGESLYWYTARGDASASCNAEADPGAYTWYIRQNGGTASQCNGLTNVDYSAGVAPDCALGHPNWLIVPAGETQVQGEVEAIRASDTIIFEAGSEYALSWGTPNTTAGGSCDSSSPFDCSSEALLDDMTIKTEGCGDGEACLQPTRLYPADGKSVRWVFNVADSDGVTIQGFDIFDKSTCVVSGVYPPESCSSDFIWEAINGSGASNLTMQHVYIHGLAMRGVLLQLLDGTNYLKDSYFRALGHAGWDSDDAGDTDNLATATTHIVRTKIDYIGCNENWQTGDIVNCWGQAPEAMPDGNYRTGYGDCIGLGDGPIGTWYYTDSEFRFCTSDGPDHIHGDGSGYIEAKRILVEGNAGNAFKGGNDTWIENSILIGNCSYLKGFGYTEQDLDFCRASGNTLAHFASGDRVMTLVNNTIVGTGDVLHEISSDDGDAEDSTLAYNNIWIGGHDWSDDPANNPAGADDLTAFSYTADVSAPITDIIEEHNLIAGTKDYATACQDGDSICQESIAGIFTGTLLQGPESGNGYYEGREGYWKELYLSSGSNARAAADNALATLKENKDFCGNTISGSPRDLGALQYGTDCSTREALFWKYNPYKSSTWNETLQNGMTLD